MKHIALTVFLGTALLAVPAAAQSLDGTWVGATPRGSSILVTITGNKTLNYVFQGRNQGLTGGQVRGNSVTFNVAGPNQGKVVMTKGQGNTASFRYTDNTGPDAMVTTVTKQ